MIFENYLESPQHIFFGLSLPEKQSNSIIAINKSVCEQIEGCNQWDQTHPPYISLYHTMIPGRNVETFFKTAETLSNQMISFSFPWSSVETDIHTILLWGSINDVLATFQLAVIETINPLRDGLHPSKYDQMLPHFTQEEKDSLNRWGSPWAEPFDPYVVIAKSKNELPLTDIDIEWDYKECIPGGVVAGIINDNQTIAHYDYFPFASS